MALRLYQVVNKSDQPTADSEQRLKAGTDCCSLTADSFFNFSLTSIRNSLTAARESNMHFCNDL